MGIVVVLFVFLVMGIIEFGRAWMIANMITHATRDGARAASVVPPENRTGGLINASAKTAIGDLVKSQIGNVMSSSGFAVDVTQNAIGSTIPTVTVTVTGNVNWLYRLVPGMGANFAVARTVTFRDEGR
jgi:Flp pilus assembly protein TadG